MKYSLTGIASFTIGIINIVYLVIFLLYINYSLDKSFNPETIIDAIFSSIAAGIIFIIILMSGFILGIISLFQKNTKKLYGVLGLAVTAIEIAIFLILVLALTVMNPGF